MLYALNLLLECGMIATVCNKVGMIPLDEEGEAGYSIPLSKKCMDTCMTVCLFYYSCGLGGITADVLLS